MGTSPQFLTEQRMFALSLAVLVAYALCLLVLAHWRDRDSVWVVALLAIQMLWVVYYQHLAETAPNAGARLPDILLLARPATLATWALVLTYCAYRLGLKYRLRKHVC